MIVGGRRDTATPFTALALLATVLLLSIGLLASSSAQTNTTGPSITGLLETDAGDAIAGVEITVQGDGFAKTVRSNMKGEWSVTVPKVGRYEVTLDAATLPEDVAIEKNQAKTSAVVESETRPKRLGFPLKAVGGASMTSPDQQYERPPFVERLRFWLGVMPSLALAAMALLLATLLSLLGWHMDRNMLSYARRKQEKAIQRYVLRKGRI